MSSSEPPPVSDAFAEAAARLKKVEIIQEELSPVVFNNAVRLTKKGKSKLGEWHKEYVANVIKELRKSKEVVLWKDFKFKLEVTFRSMSGQDAKNNMEYLRGILRSLKYERDFSIIPPYNPEMNLQTAPAFTIYKCIFAELEHQLGTSHIPQKNPSQRQQGPHRTLS